LANDRQDQKQLITLCGSFEKLTNLVISSDEVISQADLSNHDLLQHWTNIAIQKISDGKMKTVLHSINKNLVNSRDFLAFCKDAFEWVEKESQQGFDQYSKTFAHYEEEKDVWDELVRDIKGSLRENLTLDAFLQEIQMRSKEATPKKDVVLLMTIHGAKGKEFKHVYLIGMVEDELPSFQSKQKGADSPEMEEERRNCFVAITRALETLTLSYADSYRGWPKNPSRFLCEMGILVESKTENDEELPF
jgi:DNA helicase-2/ATP-dependent DNA helicase PcrA